MQNIGISVVLDDRLCSQRVDVKWLLVLLCVASLEIIKAVGRPL
jgi:hypothetical protein